MVWKCCVPGCTLSSKFPVHRFPSEPAKSEAWLRIIKRTDMIGAPKEMAKLRICTEHFLEDMIKPYGIRRNLIENSVPNRNLPDLNNNNKNNMEFENNVEFENNMEFENNVELESNIELDNNNIELENINNANNSIFENNLVTLWAYRPKDVFELLLCEQALGGEVCVAVEYVSVVPCAATVRLSVAQVSLRAEAGEAFAFGCPLVRECPVGAESTGHRTLRELFSAVESVVATAMLVRQLTVDTHPT
ncbi:uncharacterized protein [Linepithema humile]|uniref:uncharacterized protein n=1 Tax=Linepithema humile TaxID=83485 RepID=UPI00351DB01E